MVRPINACNRSYRDGAADAINNDRRFRVQPKRVASKLYGGLNKEERRIFSRALGRDSATLSRGKRAAAL